MDNCQNLVDMEELGGRTGSNYATGFLLGVGVGILMTRAWYAIAGCCQKKHEERIDQDACRDGAELESLKKLKQVELKELCALKGMAISGNKTELASRLMEWKPAASAPAAVQLKQLHELELSRKLSIGPRCYVDESLCKKAISELSKRKKATV